MCIVLQEEIHELLLSFAEAGATVVRLKGGDPLVSFCYENCLTSIMSYSFYASIFGIEFWFYRYLEGAERRWIFYNSKEFK